MKQSKTSDLSCTNHQDFHHNKCHTSVARRVCRESSPNLLSGIWTKFRSERIFLLFPPVVQDNDDDDGADDDDDDHWRLWRQSLKQQEKRWKTQQRRWETVPPGPELESVGAQLWSSSVQGNDDAANWWKLVGVLSDFRTDLQRSLRCGKHWGYSLETCWTPGGILSRRLCADVYMGGTSGGRIGMEW